MRIAVLLSGGVDSSVALRLLQEAGGHALEAFYLKIWLEDDQAFMGDCPWQTDLDYARRVCEQAGVPLHVRPFQAEYRERIVEFALAELRAGRTPSPDIQCNARIKFGAFRDAVGDAFDKVATGHYARLAPDGDIVRLLRAPDPVKDQTYFLSRLDQAQLGRALFPIGHLRKHEVRALARDMGLPTRDRPDSQGICFLGKIRFSDFVRFHLGTRQGNIVDIDTGRTLGEHEGCWFFTVGQRQGLRLGGGPWYVIRKELESNTVLVSHADRYRQRAVADFEVSDVHWIAGPPDSTRLLVKVRHGPALTEASVSAAREGRWRVVLDEPDPGIAPGQSAVFYHREECLGSGVIE